LVEYNNIENFKQSLHVKSKARLAYQPTTTQSTYLGGSSHKPIRLPSRCNIFTSTTSSSSFSFE